MQGWRKGMEDAHLAIINFDTNISLFGVFDGHGGNYSIIVIGQQVATFVKNNFPDLLKNSAAYKVKNFKQALIDSFIGIDKLLTTPEGKKQLAKINSECAKKDGFNQEIDNDELADCIGCTACVALITSNEIYVANVGDSRCVLSSNGTAVDLSNDHKPELEKEKARIYNASGFVEDNRVNGSLNLSRSLGDLNYKKNEKLKIEEQLIIPVPDIRVEPITSKTKFIIIACDGIWDCLTSQEAINLVLPRLNKGKISKIIEDIMDSVIAKDINEKNGLGCDNMTCIVVKFNNA